MTDSRTPPADIRLVALDMDGTLLDDDKHVPEEFWPLLEEMLDRGITVVPASGRQHATLAHSFAAYADRMGFIAENGTLLAWQGRVVATDTLDRATVQEVIRAVREASRTRDIGLVVCGVQAAYVERTDPAFVRQVQPYYLDYAEVPDLLEVEDGVLKCALYDFESSERGALPYVAHLAATHQVAVSGQHWVDIMNAGVHKGHGLERLAGALGIPRKSCVAFGDYLNDLELLQAAGYAVAMANAHPDLLAVADRVAPSNAEHGVVTVLRELLQR